MQIHELNNYNGSVGNDAFIAVDNGNDTGRMSIPQLLAGAESEIGALEASLNARIDNIIAGGTAPSAAEVTDARLGIDNIVYPSLGDAIRAQVTHVNQARKCFSSKNLIDTSMLTSGKYVDDTTGNLATNASYSATDFIPVEPGKPYVYQVPAGENIRPMAFYDANRDYVSGFNGLGWYEPYPFTVPNGCYFVRWSIISANIPGAMLTKGADIPAYQPFNLELEGDHLNADEAAEKIKTVSAFAPIESKNLIDLAACILGKYVDSSNGKLGTHPNYSATDYIKVKPGETYTFSIYSFPTQAVERYALYDENKKYVTGSLNSGITGSYTFTVPNDCYFIRWSLVNLYKEYSQLEVGSVATVYQKYRKYVKDEYLPKMIKTVGSNNCDYTSLLEALKDTDTTVELHVKSGIYDIVAEYESYYGASFWSDYAGYSGVEDPFYKGLWLGKGRRVIGEAGTIISFPYTGNNNDVKDWFAIFANDTDVLLENLTITAASQCCRYAIHDDFQPVGGTVEFRNLFFDLTPNKHAIIGAGLGTDTVYIIDHCIFENNNKVYDIHYHGNTVPNQDTHCRLFVTNCYGSKFCTFAYSGDSTEVSDAVVNGCKFQGVECVPYGGAAYQNIRMIAWNNITN